MKRKTKNKIPDSPIGEILQQLDKEELDKERAIADKNDTTLLDEFETQLSSNEPIRELLTPKNIKFKTELTEEQRGAVAILYHAYKLCLEYNIDFSALKYVLDEYIDFGVSIDRKGRTEYVEAHRAQQLSNQLQQQQLQQQGMSQMKM